MVRDCLDHPRGHRGSLTALWCVAMQAQPADEPTEEAAGKRSRWPFWVLGIAAIVVVALVALAVMRRSATPTVHDAARASSEVGLSERFCGDSKAFTEAFSGTPPSGTSKMELAEFYDSTESSLESLVQESSGGAREALDEALEQVSSANEVLERVGYDASKLTTKDTQRLSDPALAGSVLRVEALVDRHCGDGRTS